MNFEKFFNPQIFINNETPVHMFSCEFWEIFQPLIYQKQERGADVFFWFLRIFSACIFIKNEPPTHVFSFVNFGKCFRLQRDSCASVFLGVFQRLKNTYFAELLWTVASNVWLSLNYLHNFCCSFKWKIKRYQ